jgi:hypothetical protein
MFMMVLLGIIALAVLIFTMRWALSQPHGPLDGAARVLAATIAGGLIAAWLVAASLAPQLNEDTRTTSGSIKPPTQGDARHLLDEIVLSAPVSLDIAAAVGAGVGFFIALASVGSYRRAT